METLNSTPECYVPRWRLYQRDVSAYSPLNSKVHDAGTTRPNTRPPTTGSDIPVLAQKKTTGGGKANLALSTPST